MNLLGLSNSTMYFNTHVQQWSFFHEGRVGIFIPLVDGNFKCRRPGTKKNNLTTFFRFYVSTGFEQTSRDG